jgi:hypothetical protein
MELKNVNEVVKIPHWNLIPIKTRLTKVNNHLVKMGAEPLTINISPMGGEVVNGMLTKFFSVEVQGNMPVFQGYKLLARISHGKKKETTASSFFEDTSTHDGVAKTHNIVVTYGEVKEDWWTCAPRCDHCGWKRNRNETIVVEKDGKELQIGSACASEFFPIDAAKDILQLFDTMSDLRQATGSTGANKRLKGAKEPPFVELHNLLAVMNSRIEVDNFDNRRFYSGFADLIEKQAASEGTYRHTHQPTELSIQFASEAIEYVKGLPPVSDLTKNMQSIIEAGGVRAGKKYRKEEYLVCTISRTYNYHAREVAQLKKQKEREEAEAKAQEEQAMQLALLPPVPTVTVTEEKCTVQGKLIKNRAFNGKFGKCFIVVVEQDKSQYVWFTPKAIEIAEGTVVTMEGLVKPFGIGSYNGIRQVKMTRCTVRV